MSARLGLFLISCSVSCSVLNDCIVLCLVAPSENSSFDLMPQQHTFKFGPQLVLFFSTPASCLEGSSSLVSRVSSVTLPPPLALRVLQSVWLMEPLTAPLNLNGAG